MKKIIVLFTTLSVLAGCAGKSGSEEELQQIKQNTIDSINKAQVKQRTIDSMNKVNGKAVEKNTQKQEVTTTTTTNTGTGTTTTTTQKKGWSKTAKGAVIGAGVGAIGGAIIDKKHPGQGAILGGALGAGAGAVTGNVMDKKDGRK
ncbi:YMGG-like glycine zipper-containing protein [Ferruginibacter albus]|uniref:YMGG-like glycine zipper-containing protein n=1 Tax=Ferruginibacter albus TaxID=2875540 RepID=UPI001CC54B0F|nr:YMGG-like glycine zipper-containing protein [Ferruginibacter albus]UAY53270.1 glycine zipper 2TM domain-containing protein [Ferruginibacter albus]